MEYSSSSTVRMSMQDAKALGVEALRRVGLDEEEADIIADHVVDAAMCGYGYSGLPKLLNLIESPRFAQPRQAMTWSNRTGPVCLLDGGNHNGMYVLHQAAQSAAERAEIHGMAMVGVCNTWMSGRSAYYVEMLSKAGYVGIHTVASSPVVAAPGGRAPVLGTNPIAFAFPTETEPLLIDMGTSAFMMTEVRYRRRLGIQLPEGVALDRYGAPTTDPGAAADGLLLPFGGHKGFALSLAIHALGLMCSTQELPHQGGPGALMIAVRPDLSGSIDAYRSALSQWLQSVKDAPRQAGMGDIRLPGERSARARAAAELNGIEVAAGVVDALRAHAAGSSVGL
ncbi:Ldh family oxidoreductase [Candidimonas nitroreducens]|nr:Ldh family oxidoreductase [Candidimonas nitroreducens]